MGFFFWDAEDMTALMTWWGQAVPPAPAYLDFDGSGVIDSTDEGILNAKLGQPKLENWALAIVVVAILLAAAYWAVRKKRKK